MKLVLAARRLVRKILGQKVASHGSCRRTMRLSTGVENLEGRALLSKGLSEFPIDSPVGGGDDQLECIISGPDKSLWFLDNYGSGEQIGKISSAGAVTWFPPINDPNAFNAINFLTTGPDGNVWFNTSSAIGEITPAGAITLYPAPAIAASVTGLTAGADGNVWFTSDSSAQGVSVVGDITPAGEITTFPIPSSPETGPIVLGSDGELWFGALVSTNTTSGSELEMGSVTPPGQITMHPIGQAENTYDGIGVDLTRGPDGKPWLVDGGLPLLTSKGKTLPQAILEIDPSGHVKRVKISLASDRLLGAIAPGPKNSVYFTVTDNDFDVGPNDQPTIGTLSASGHVSFHSVPEKIPPHFSGAGYFSPEPVTVGSDGSVWYITDTNGGQAIVRLKT